MGEPNMKTIIITLVIAFSFASSVAAKAKKRAPLKCPSKPGKIIVCHIPPGNPENMRILSISPSAIQSHLDHGDTSGICDSTEYAEMKALCGICDTDVDPTCG